MTPEQEVTYWAGRILEQRLLFALRFAPVYNLQRDETYGTNYCPFHKSLNLANSGQNCPLNRKENKK